MLQADIRRLKHLNRRVEQIKSYRGTKRLPDDDERLEFARRTANQFLVRCLMWHLGRQSEN